MQIADLQMAHDAGSFEVEVLTAFIKAAEVRDAKNGVPFLRLTLQDKTGEIQCTIFNVTEAVAGELAAGQIVTFRNLKFNEYNGKLGLLFGPSSQYVIRNDVDRSDYILTTIPDPTVLRHKLTEHISSIRNTRIRNMCISLTCEPEFKERFFDWPAAKSRHHAEKHGLLFHTVRMMDAGAALCDVYTAADRDMVIAGILFHDFGKIRELNATESWVGEYTPQTLLGHIYIGAAKIHEYWLAGKISDEQYLQLAHIILSHHGTKEYGSPVTPATIEAYIVHYIDDMDAKINAAEFAFLTMPEGTLAGAPSQNMLYRPMKEHEGE